MALHEKPDNKNCWLGAKICVFIEGNWTTYRVFAAGIVGLYPGTTAFGLSMCSFITFGCHLSSFI